MGNTAYLLEDAGFTREQVDALTTHWEGSVATKQDITLLRSEVKEDFAHLDAKIDTTTAELRGEIKEDIANLRGEIKEDIAHLDGKIDTVAAELRGEIKDLRGEVKEDHASLRGEMKELRGELKYIKWIGAGILAGILIPLIKASMG